MLECKHNMTMATLIAQSSELAVKCLLPAGPVLTHSASPVWPRVHLLAKGRPGATGSWRPDSL